MKRTLILAMVCIMALIATAQNNGIIGFAGYSDLGLNSVTGGGAGQVVHVKTRAEFNQYISSNDPYVIILDNDIEGKGINNMNDEVAIGSNTTLIGAGAGKMLNGICLETSGKSNIILRNIILKKGRTDGIGFRNTHHVWIDHCDLSESYDGLLDFTLGSDYMTVTWTKLHHHDKVSITNSGTCHYEDYNKEHVTFAHCWFANNTQRNPRIGYGRMHIYNCYWTDISSYCIGFHSQAQVQSMNNYFTATAKNPFNNQYSSDLPYRGYLTDNGSYFANGKPAATYSHAYTDATYRPETFYGYDFDIVEASAVPEATKHIGPMEGLQYEPILCPANGAIDVPVTQLLSWGKVDGATATRVMLGTSRDALSEVSVNSLSLAPATKYYWQVIATVGGEEHASPVYQFTTASEKASKPTPEVGAKTAWLRWPTSQDKFCSNMPLMWRQAADAKSYKVYFGTEATGVNYIGETTGLSYTLPMLVKTTGETYYWRVDVVKNDGTTVTGDVWTFTPLKKEWKAGSNEVYSAYVSGIAFRESVGDFTGGKGVRGDQGPGVIHAVWAGATGKYAIETTTYDQNLGPNLVGVAVNGKLVDCWMTSDEQTQLSVRKTRHTVDLQPGDEVSIEFVAGYVNGGLNESVAHIDQINFIATDQDIIETTRKSGIHHTPVASKGFEYENIRLDNILFTDTLGTVGDYNSRQVKDMYCSWITKNEASYTFYITNCSIIEKVYSDGTTEREELTKTEKYAYEVAATKGTGTLTAVHLYKNLPTKTSYYAPVADAGKDYQLILSPDYIYLDSNGEKGEPGKKQVRKEYEEWIKYTNPSNNEVQAKQGSDGIKAFIDPVTDAKVSNGKVIYGADRSSYSYVVGTEKYMTYYLQNCAAVKFYYSGTGGAATNLYVEATEAGNSANTTRIYGEDAPGKNVASETVEISIDPARLYHVKIMATTGDMLIYAMKLWPGSADGIQNIYGSDMDTDGLKIYNLHGQRILNPQRGQVVIINGMKHVVR